MMPDASPIAGTAAGVPYIAVPPSSGRSADAPVVVAWHLMDPPRTEAAFAAALPLDGLDAWRIYLGLPMCGSRTPPDGQDELMRLGYEDAVLNIQGPVAAQAEREFGPALDGLHRELGIGSRPIGLLGGSMGAAVAQLVIAEGDVEISAAVLVSPLVQLRPAVEAIGRRFGVTYLWSGASLDVAGRLDFVARADQLAKRGQPAVLLVVGTEDDPAGFRQPAERLHAALSARYADPQRARLTMITGMGHPLADEPGLEPAPQTPHAREVDQHAVRWLQRHLADR